MRTNKKAQEPSIIIFVVMVLVLCIYVLYSFSTGIKGVEGEVSSYNVLNQFNSNEKELKFYIGDIGEKAFASAYQEFFESGDYLENPTLKDGYSVFENLNANANAKLAERTRLKFLEEIQKYNFEEDYLKNFKTRANDIKISASDDYIVFVIENFELRDSNSKVKVSYIFNLEVRLNYGEIQLDSLQSIVDAKEICDYYGDLQNCFFQNLRYFNSDVTQTTNPGEYIVKLDSMKKFLINGEFKDVRINFVLN